jgi:hypothetical protein
LKLRAECTPTGLTNSIFVPNNFSNFGSKATWQRLLFYRATNDNGPWDVISVSPEAFLTFLEAWAAFLSRGFAREVLAASEAA